MISPGWLLLLMFQQFSVNPPRGTLSLLTRNCFPGALPSPPGGICLLCGLRKIDIFYVVLNSLRTYEIVPGPAEQLDNVTSKTFARSYFLLLFF